MSKHEKAIKEITNAILKDKASTELGQKARVERSTLPNDDHTDALREVIRDVARDLQSSGKATKGMQYMGSLTVHVFGSEALRMMEFVPLTVTDRFDAVLADAACHALRNSVLADFGKRMQKKRSGF